MGFLSDHCARIRRDLAEQPLDVPALRARVATVEAPRGFTRALKGAKQQGVVGVIAEVKQASPSAGAIRVADPAEQAAAYAAAGATAVSVLTEPRHFGGSLADLEAAHASVEIPVMRKDFIVHPDQLLEARAHGADAALLIATVLSDEELAELLAVAGGLGLGTLVEAFGASDLERAVASGAPVVGVNARDLESLEVDAQAALDLLRTIPEDRVRVFESGISEPEQVRAATDAGADAILVGTALMLADDPGEKLRTLRGEVV